MGKSALLPLLFGSVLIASACGGNVQDGSDSSPNDDASPVVEASVDASSSDGDGGVVTKTDAGYPGPHPDVPQVQDYGGPTLTAPNVIPIFFQNDSEQSQIEDFLKQLAASPFWAEATKEYAVGALTVGKSIVVTDTPPTNIDYTQIETWLEGYVDADAGWPPVVTNNIYTVFYPSSTTITLGSYGTSCHGFGGFHSQALPETGPGITYAVLPRCSSLGVSITGFDALTSGLSHELIEASTDPQASFPAYSYVDEDHMVWNLMPLGEIGDMCAYEPQSYQRLVGSYMVQRPWSNASAKAGHDPCVPVLSAPYFNSAPVLTDTVTLDYYGQQVPTYGVKIPLGQSKTIPVQLFSDAPTSDWTVQAFDSTYNTGKAAQLQFSWDKQSGNNGDTVNLTITRVGNGAYNGTEFMIWSQHGTSVANLWFGFVQN